MSTSSSPPALAAKLRNTRAMHKYGSPGPIGATVRPGPNGNPELDRSRPATGADSARGGQAQAPMLGTSLARRQQLVYDQHAEAMRRQQQRVLTGSIYGQQVAGLTMRGQRTASSPLLSAGVAVVDPS
mmetsp:Transcript_82594/g.233716  ORF Transcript_82594/g.233716 Transcript_82594/m.233716 type:complete len:128 (+) Transcript_82594:2-385(+)